MHTFDITGSKLETLTHVRGTFYVDNLLSSAMIKQNIIQAALLSIETFGGIKSKFEAWTESIENTAQISGQNAIYIAFSKLTGSSLWHPIG